MFTDRVRAEEILSFAIEKRTGEKMTCRIMFDSTKFSVQDMCDLRDTVKHALEVLGKRVVNS